MFAHVRMRLRGQRTASIQRRVCLSGYAPARILAISAAFFATGCASFSPDGGMEGIKGIARTELNSDVVALSTEDQVKTTRFEVDRLLKRPLTEATAVQIAHHDLEFGFRPTVGLSL